MTVRSSVNTIKSMLQNLKALFYDTAQLNGLTANENTSLPEYVEIFERRLSSNWEYPDDWIDVHKVMEEDTYDKTAYPLGRVVHLLLNNQETSTFSLGNNSYTTPQAIKTSDGAFYTYSANGSSVTHTWDTKAKTCYVIYYFKKGDVRTCHKTYMLSNTLFTYIDCSSFQFNKDNSPTYTTHPLWQGLECTKESIFKNIDYLQQVPLEYVNLPFDKEKSTVNGYMLYYAPFLKYFYASKINPASIPYGTINYMDWSCVDWASYSGTNIGSNRQTIYNEGIIDLSGYTSDTTVSIALFYGNLNVKIKLPNAPIYCFLGRNCASIIKPSTWEYIADNAPVVDGRTLTLETYGYASLKAAGNAYQTLINKGWVIQ